MACFPDIIKSKGFLKGDTSYDYAHNPLPNRYYGQPEFSKYLLKKFIQEKNDEGIVLSLSWRAHQVSDVFAHHVPLNGWWGYVNSENFFGPFWKEVIKHFKDQVPSDLPGAFYRADHWISELIIDLFCYMTNGSNWGKEILNASPQKYLKAISDVSLDYLSEYSEQSKNEYEETSHIQVNELKRGMQFSDALNSATIRYFNSLIKKKSIGKLSEMIYNHGKFSNVGEMLDLVAYQTAQALIKPFDDWKAPEVNAKLFINGNSSVKDVFPRELPEEKKPLYFSEQVESQWKNYQPKREGLVKLVLEKTPLTPVKWIVCHTSLVTSDGFIYRALLPKGRTSYAMSLRYAFNIRDRDEENLMTILRRTLEEVDVIDVIDNPASRED